MRSDKICKAMGRWPDFIIGEEIDPYLLRWWLTPWSRLYKDIRWQDLTRWQRFVRSLPNIYLHKFMRSDDDRALHDHPWANISLLLKGSYIEHMPFDPKAWQQGDRETTVKIRKPGHIVFRRATAIHRVELFRKYEPFIPRLGWSFVYEQSVWSLFLTGPRVRDWGFWCPQGWRHWLDFVSLRKGGNDVGPGCE